MSDSPSPPREHEEDQLSLQRIRQLAELMKECGLSRLEVSDKGRRIRLCRGNEPESAPAMAWTAAGRARSSEPAGGEAREETLEAEKTEDHVVVIKSPMVGTFYTKANPEAEPYVRAGDHVEPDTVVCVIEAMKVFNEIPAEVSGRVMAVLVDNEESVDFGKPLFKIDTSG
jgi:acetyl-CoA carboxylase biotin carboxyl carrier protein